MATATSVQRGGIPPETINKFKLVVARMLLDTISREDAEYSTKHVKLFVKAFGFDFESIKEELERKYWLLNFDGINIPEETKSIMLDILDKSEKFNLEFAFILNRDGSITFSYQMKPHPCKIIIPPDVVRRVIESRAILVHTHYKGNCSASLIDRIFHLRDIVPLAILCRDSNGCVKLLILRGYTNDIEIVLKKPS